MKRLSVLFITALLALTAWPPALSAQPAETVPPTILPLSVLLSIIHETSGDLALQNEIFLAGVNRNRKAEEYAQGYFEPKFLIEKLKEYGIPDCRIIDLPTRSPQTWDAVRGELWITKPVKRKIADHKEIAASLCSGSATMDVSGTLVYVGPGNQDRYYEGKDVKGKIVLVNGSPGGAQRIAVEKLGALAVVAYSASHSEFDPDEVGWSSISGAAGMKPTVGFMISARQGNDLRDQLERGAAIEVRAMAETQMVQAKDQMVEAVIPGREFPGEELVFTAHLYEGVTKQGANDNISGCVAILETARTLRKLMDDGAIPPLKRTVRFLFVPEIGGTQSYLKMVPDIAARFFAVINEDMVGEGLIQHQSVMELVQAPVWVPHFLNDVVRAVYEWVGTTQRREGREAYLPIHSPTGSRDPFYYVIDPYSGGSDHIVFADSGIRVPAVMMIVWPDMWYHTSGDTVDKSDSTQLKRAAFIGAASAVFLAGAGPAEAEILIAEVGGRTLERLGRDNTKAVRRVREADAAKLFEAYREANNFLTQAFLREDEILASIRLFIKGDVRLEGLLKAQIAAVGALRQPLSRDLEEGYKARCSRDKIVPQRIVLTVDEIRLGKLFPQRTEKMKGAFDGQAFAAARREMKDAPATSLGQAESLVRHYIDGKRSILLIRNAAAAVASQAVPLLEVEKYLRVLEKAGFIKIRQM